MFLAGGFVSRVTSPQFAMQDYLPHVKLPVLLLTGRLDFEFPYETSQKPFWATLNGRNAARAPGYVTPLTR